MRSNATSALENETWINAQPFQLFWLLMWLLSESMLKCEQKNLIDGEYQPQKAKYSLNEKITPHCKPEYYLWGPPSLTCSELPPDSARWHYPGCDVPAHAELFQCGETLEPECVTLAEFENKCQNVGGRANSVTRKGKVSMICEKPVEETGKSQFFV